MNLIWGGGGGGGGGGGVGRENKFYDVEGFPAIILPEENPL